MMASVDSAASAMAASVEDAATTDVSAAADVALLATTAVNGSMVCLRNWAETAPSPL
jgi:hypothetical protein